MKKMLLVAMLCLAGYVGQAAYLYWQVDDSAKETKDSKFTGDFVGATVFAVDSSSIKYGPNGRVSNGTALAVADPETGITTTPGVFTMAKSTENVYAINLNNLAGASGYSFYIELVNYDAAKGALTSVAQSGVMSYQELVQSNYIIEDTGISIPTASTAWHGSAYAPGPEPTSALMMLLGVAFLGLKRRRI